MNANQPDRLEIRRRVLQALRGETSLSLGDDTFSTTETELAEWRQSYLRQKLPSRTAEVPTPVSNSTIVQWDNWGIPHIRARSLSDLYFALGYAMAQERLWQLDYMRRLPRGQLAEIFGPNALPSDRFMRTLGIGRAGDAAAEALPDEVSTVLESLSAGINLWSERAIAEGILPFEYDLLDYEPAPWRPSDSIVVWKYRWWTLTGRLESIAAMEAARRLLPANLYEAFAETELAEETIIPGSGSASGPGDDNGTGSNNWTVASSRTTTGGPALASDPHNLFAAPSQWFEAQLVCPGMDTAGAIYVGTPGVYLGRNRDVAWAVTNHTASARDLFAEEVHPDDTTRYRDGQCWRAFEIESQEIAVRGSQPEVFEVRRTVRGPIANSLLPSVGSELQPPLSLAWIGAGIETGFDAMLALQRASSAGQVLDALRLWPCPPLNFVYADRQGHIGYHAAGLVPHRAAARSGFRQANDPDDAWNGFVPFDSLPQLADPPRGWVATANNVPQAGSSNYLSIGAWSAGYRHRRIRERLTKPSQLTLEDLAAIQADVLDARARDLTPALLQAIAHSDDPLVEQAAGELVDWDYRFHPSRISASIFAAFWVRWTERVARARFPDNLVPLVLPQIGAVARRCLLGEDSGWFRSGDLAAEATAAFCEGLDWLTQLAGGDMADWQWGRLHQVTFRHPLGDGSLAALLNIGPAPTSGGNVTVRAAAFEGRGDQPFAVVSGSTYRLVVDLSASDVAWSTTTSGQSAHPASSHYRDQTTLWLSDRHHPLWMAESDVLANLEGTTVLLPMAPGRS